MTISDYQSAYEHFRTPPNLADHQRRVAGVAKAITDGWIEPPINQNDIIEAALYHDMGNIIKYNLDKPLVKNIDVNYWRQVKSEYIAKYGTNVHDATIAICREMNLSEAVIRLIKQDDWYTVKELIQTRNYPAAIAVYSDMRVSPYGIQSAEDRIKNLATRSAINIDEFIDSAHQLESFIQPHTKTNLQSISDATVSLI